jgi:N-acetylglutamate synthase-like GNAT family acetyltransferase
MDSPLYRVRRATVEDLEALRELWRLMHLPASDLERRVTEFQVAESGDGHLHGALGLEINGRQGRLHGEVFSDFALAETLRELLWHRMQALALSHGLARFWTLETAPFWKRTGFQPPDDTALKRLPAAWAEHAPRFLTLGLRDEEALEKALQSNFELLKAEEQRRTQQFVRRGKIIKFVVTLLTLGLAAFVAVMSVRALLSHAGGLHR